MNYLCWKWIITKDYLEFAALPRKFTQTEDFKLWSKDRKSHSNAYDYFRMVKERNYATRLEF